MTQHTPGPWRTNGIFVSDPKSIDGIVSGCDPDKSEQELVANARLIAAAPELLEVAELFFRTLEYQILKDRKKGDEEGANLKEITIQKVISVINKARGES